MMEITININLDPALLSVIHDIASSLKLNTWVTKPAKEKPVAEAATESLGPCGITIDGAEAASEEVSDDTEILEEVPRYTIEVVREKLVRLSQSGKSKEVKALISTFGTNKLSEIPEEKFAEILAAAARIA